MRYWGKNTVEIGASNITLILNLKWFTWNIKLSSCWILTR